MGITVSFCASRQFNYAAAINQVPLIEEIRIKNSGKIPTGELKLEILSRPAFFTPFSMDVGSVKPGETRKIQNICIRYDAGRLVGYTESINGDLEVRLVCGKEPVYDQCFPVELRPFDEISHYGGDRPLSAAFVQPNHPEIIRLLSRISQIRGQKYGNYDIDGYYGGKEGQIQLVSSMFQAVREQEISYVLSKPSGTAGYQRIRLADELLREKQANCMDMTLLFASLLEGMGLHPLVILLEEHALAGFFTGPDSFSQPVFTDIAELHKRMARDVGSIMVFECTLARKGSAASFEDAVRSAQKTLLGAKRLEPSLDIYRARQGGISPLPSRFTRTDIFVEADKKTGQICETMPKTPEMKKEDTVKAYQAPDRMERWQNDLLDMTARSALVNIPVSSAGRGALPILTVDGDILYQKLCSGESFTIEARPQDFEETKRSQPLFERLSGVYGCRNIILESLEKGVLHTVYAQTTVEKALSVLRNRDRQWREDRGASVLYMTFGTLRWKDEKSGRYYEAPLLMVPMTFRKDGRRYQTAWSGGTIFFNGAVLELLRQRFDKRPDGLTPVPCNSAGYPELRTVYKNLRLALEGEPDLDVWEHVCLGLFPFSQYLMWHELNTYKEIFKSHPLIKGIMDGVIMDGVLEKDKNDFWSKDKNAEIFFPIPADVTQRQAVKGALSGQSMVLNGPPGNGKSQVICSILTNFIAEGKTVLLGAQKAAALQVVFDRLEKLGLGDFCLYLPEESGRRCELETLLRKLDRILRMDETDGNHYEEQREKALAISQELEQEAALFGELTMGGRSLGEWMDQYIKTWGNGKASRFFSAEDQKSGPELDEKLQAGKMNALRALLEELGRVGRQLGDIAHHPLNGLALSGNFFRIQQCIRPALETYIAALENVCCLKRQLEMERKTGDPTRQEGRTQGNDSLADCLDHIRQTHIFLQIPENLRKEADLEKKLEIWAEWLQHKAMRQNLLGSFGEAVMTLPVKEWYKEWQEVRWSSNPVNRIRKNSIRRQVGAKMGKPKPTDREVTECLKAAFRLAESWNGKRPDFTLPLDLAGTIKLRDIVRKYFPDDTLERFYANLKENDKGETQRREDIIRSGGKAAQDLRQLLGDLPGIWSFDQSPEEALKKAERWLEGLDQLNEWRDYQNIRKNCLEEGLRYWIRMYESCGSDTRTVMDFENHACGRMIRLLYESSEKLRDFSGGRYERLAENYKQLEKAMEAAAASQIRKRHADRIQKILADPLFKKQKTDLRRIIENGGKGMSIRKVMSICADLILKLTPCVMVSPMTAPLYLDPDKIHFEHLILDEASQIPTCKAIGLIARCDHAVIGGDPNQMPPTSFFENDRSDESVSVLDDDQESILKECIALGLPEYHLKWHYRSRHESLISFSNQRYYGGGMQTFPSADERSKWVTVVRTKGIYDRGRSMTNRKEAEALVDFLEAKLLQGDGRSYGIISFNQRQQELICRLVEKRGQDNLNFGKCLQKLEEQGEPLFIRNLESVQGDERDVILFSVGYGPDKAGRLTMTFGPLSRVGGWRRLNVAITRAKDQMILFTSMDSSQIRSGVEVPRGVADLKAFLAYAEGKEAEDPGVSDQPESHLQKQIQKCLTAHGYDSVCSVGQSEMKVDVGVLDPEGPGRFLLGIVINGTGQDGRRSVYDREIGRMEMLERRGWNWIRTWSADWILDPSREEKRLIRKLEILSQTRHSGTGGSI